MPRQNRITPTSETIATPARGLFMGNRGCLHDEQGRIVRAYEDKRWIICLLEFKGRRRQVMKPGSYTELFFLDEVTALAAGHRPCSECMRTRFVAFRDAWIRGNPELAEDERLSASQLDARLHRERLERRAQRTHHARTERLPSGAFVRIGGDPTPRLVLGEYSLRWSPDGYSAPELIAGVGEVEVLTPRSVVEALRAGYRPTVHPSGSELVGARFEDPEGDHFV